MITDDPLYQQIMLPEDESYMVNDYETTKRDLWSIKNHYHDIYEIVLYREMTGITFLNGNRENLLDNSILYLPPYCVHGFDELSHSSNYVMLHISFNFQNRLPSYPMLLRLTENETTTIESLMNWAKCRESTEDLREQSIKLILTWINNINYNDKVEFRSYTTIFKPLLQQLDRSREYNISSRDAADLCGMSRSSFLKKFKTHFNTTFHTFLTEKKITEARYLLGNSQSNCTEVANILGFSDSAHFSRVFKKVTGTLPKEFQMNNR